MAIYIKVVATALVACPDPNDPKWIETIESNLFLSCDYELTDEDCKLEPADESHVKATYTATIKVQDPYDLATLKDVQETTHLDFYMELLEESYKFETQDAD